MMADIGKMKLARSSAFLVACVIFCHTVNAQGLWTEKKSLPGPLPGLSSALAFSPDGKMLYASGSGGTIAYLIESADEVGWVARDTNVIRFSPRGDRVSIEHALDIEVWNADLSQRVAYFPRRRSLEPFEPDPPDNNGHISSVIDLAFVDDDQLISIGTAEIAWWKLAPPSQKRKIIFGKPGDLLRAAAAPKRGFFGLLSRICG